MRSLGSLFFNGGQQVLAVHALDEAGAAQHLFDLVRLQMADEMAGLAAVGPGVKIGAELLHMVLAKHINGQGCTGGNNVRCAGLAGGTELHRCRVAARFPGGCRHLGADLFHRFPHFFQCLFRHRSILLGIFCALTTDELGAGAGTENVCFADLIQAQAHRHGHPLEVHPDESAADVDARMSLDLFHGDRVMELLPAGGGPAAARVGPGAPHRLPPSRIVRRLPAR